MIQGFSDLFLGWTSDGERDYYARQLRDMKGTLVPESSTPNDLLRYAELCGWVLARAHARSGDSAQISGYLGKSPIFDAAPGASRSRTPTKRREILPFLRRPSKTRSCWRKSRKTDALFWVRVQSRLEGDAPQMPARATWSASRRFATIRSISGSSLRDSAGGKMDIQGKKGEKIWGVVYHIEELEIGLLDQGEGFDPGSPRETYERIELMVFDEDRDKAPLTVWTYRGSKRAERGRGNRPTEQYLKLIVEEAKHWHLPANYVALLEAVKTHDGRGSRAS